RRPRRHGRRSLLRRRVGTLHRHRSPPGRHHRLRRPGLPPLRAVRDRPAANEAGLGAGASADLRGKGGEDREGEPRPRPALPLRGAATPAWLPRSAQIATARRCLDPARTDAEQAPRTGNAPPPRRERTPRQRRPQPVRQTGFVEGRRCRGEEEEGEKLTTEAQRHREDKTRSIKTLLCFCFLSISVPLWLTLDFTRWWAGCCGTPAS